MNDCASFASYEQELLLDQNRSQLVLLRQFWKVYDTNQTHRKRRKMQVIQCQKRLIKFCLLYKKKIFTEDLKVKTNIRIKNVSFALATKAFELWKFDF
jgi:hypothetical protein